jgi:hypothetical protein
MQLSFKLFTTKLVANWTPRQIENWLAEYAVTEMKKGGPYKDLRAAPTDLGPFKLLHVSGMCFFSFTLFALTTSFLARLTIHRLRKGA